MRLELILPRMEPTLFQEPTACLYEGCRGKWQLRGRRSHRLGVSSQDSCIQFVCLGQQPDRFGELTYPTRWATAICSPYASS